MNSSQRFLAALVAVCFTAVAAFAADSSPAGTWKWTQQGFEMTLKLELKDSNLTGMLAARDPERQIPDLAISDGSFKNGVVKFTLARNDRTAKFEGKLEGDTITGSTMAPGRDSIEPTKRDWVATRAK